MPCEVLAAQLALTLMRDLGVTSMQQVENVSLSDLFQCFTSSMLLHYLANTTMYYESITNI